MIAKIGIAISGLLVFFILIGYIVSPMMFSPKLGHRTACVFCQQAIVALPGEFNALLAEVKQGIAQTSDNMDDDAIKEQVLPNGNLVTVPPKVKDIVSRIRNEQKLSKYPLIDEKQSSSESAENTHSNDEDKRPDLLELTTQENVSAPSRDGHDTTTQQVPTNVTEATKFDQTENSTALESETEQKISEESVSVTVPKTRARNVLNIDHLNLEKADLYQYIDKSIGTMSHLNITQIGRWKEGTKFEQTCDLKHEEDNCVCCTDKVRKMHFEFFDNDMRNDEAVLVEFLNKMHGKNVTLFGDSIQKNLFHAWAELLKLGKCCLIPCSCVKNLYFWTQKKMK